MTGLLGTYFGCLCALIYTEETAGDVTGPECGQTGEKGGMEYMQWLFWAPGTLAGLGWL